MSDLTGKFLQAFIPLFVAIDPIGLAAIFLEARPEACPPRRAGASPIKPRGPAVAWRCSFYFSARPSSPPSGITMHDFQIAGGLILAFIIAAREHHPVHRGGARLSSPTISA